MPEVKPTDLASWKLDAAFAEQLDTFVAARYRELHAEVAAAKAEEVRE